MNTYIEIVESKTEKVIRRVDVTGRGERNIDRIENGININLNHSEYFTRVTDSENKLQTGDIE